MKIFYNVSESFQIIINQSEINNLNAHLEEITLNSKKWDIF